MRYLLLLSVSAILIWQVAVAAPDCEGSCPVYKMAPEPACGDGKEYYDECRAKCAGAKHITPGPCPTQPPCICPKIYRQVCGDGVTYGNRCLALCAGAKRITKGPCCRPCTFLCINIYDPVCADGVTYGNSCLVSCVCPRPKKIVPGECPKRG